MTATPVQAVGEWRTCSGCGETKPLGDFYLVKRRRGRLLPTPQCKPCHIATSNRYRAEVRADPERRAAHRRKERDRKLRRQYGIGVDEYDELLANQGGCCAVCRAAEAPDADADRYETGQRYAAFVVDHDHGTGEVRGILCRNCNSGLGMFGDDPAALRSAASYLEGGGSR